MRIKQSLLVTLAALLLLISGTLVQPSSATNAAPSATYDLSWWTVDGGGDRSAAGSYALEGTAGQSDVGPGMTGESYILEGGFWGGRLSGFSIYTIYLPLVLRNR